MSAQPIGVAGHPSAWAIGRGIAMTSGVTWMGLASAGASGGWPWSARRWLTIAPHDAAAGDHTTGRGSDGSSGQPDDKRSAAAPDDFFCTFTVEQPLSWAALLLLKSLASWVSSDTFSGELAMLTVVHPPPPALPPPDEEQAARTVAKTNAPKVAAPRLTWPRSM